MKSIKCETVSDFAAAAGVVEEKVRELMKPELILMYRDAELTYYLFPKDAS